MKNKKLFSGAILSLLSLSLLVGCGKGNTPEEDESKEPNFFDEVEEDDFGPLN